MMKLHAFASLSLGALMVCCVSTAAAQQAARSPYLIQLTDAPVATYEGGVGSLAATRPKAGQRLDMASARVQAYSAYLNSKVSGVAAKVPSAPVYYRYGVAVTGFGAMLTADELRKLQADPAVKAITADEPMRLDTNYTTSQFLGLGAAGGAWSRLDSNGKNIQGENIIIAMVDTGVWPENPSVSDKVGANGKPVPSHEAGTVVYDPLPAGRYRGSCQVGEAFTAAMCNNKLVGAQVFQTTFLQVNSGNVWPGEYLSPRDEDGHGSHTLTTAGGNANSQVSILGSGFEITGVAPRARLASYKACSSYINATGARQNSCYSGDTVAAIDKAVADGVDVINFSIGGSQTAVNGIVAQAMMGAAKAGVFVAASAGNSGPGNEVAHISPWVATVGNSTHDRYAEATVTLQGAPGNGYMASGPSFQTTGVPAAQLILSTDAGLAGVDPNSTRLKQCFGAADGVAPLLDPDKVRNKILVCYRGGNAFVNKAANAQAAGAVAYIAQNVAIATPASATSLFTVAAVIPMVHLQTTHETQVFAHARVGGMASFSPSFAVAGAVAPVMSGSSSRGPNKLDVNVMKPDITAPGTDIIAAYTPAGVNAAERAGLIAGTVVGRPGATMISGTSMSSPHVAGAAALLKQARPTWSPAAIKSALMTSAQQSVKLANNSVDTNRWGFGAGHLAPNLALSTAMVYDISNAQYDAYLAGTLRGLNLNLSSITFGNVLGLASTTRTVTNTGASPVTVNAAITMPGFDVTVTPMSLTVPAGGTATYDVKVAKQAATVFNAYRFGEVVWTGGGQTIRSPLTARASALVAYSVVEDTRAIGSRIFTVGTGFAGPMVTVPSGMVPATRRSGSVVAAGQTCFGITVPTGGQALRAQLFGSETAAPDLDITLYNAAGAAVASSAGGTSDEVLSLALPAAGAYTACVEGYDTGAAAAATFTLNSWVVPTPTGPQTLRAAGPSNAVLGGTASVVAGWSTAAGTRSLGVVGYKQSAAGPLIGLTQIFVDASGAPAIAQAPVLRDKQRR